jgi:hypothetical protein
VRVGVIGSGMCGRVAVDLGGARSVEDSRSMRGVRWGTAGGAAVAVVAVVALTLTGAACGASLPTSGEAAAAETADTVCTLLRRWNNELSATFNATSQAITDADDPDTSVDTLVDGFDEMIATAEAHRAEVDDLELPAVDERDDLLAELAAGADESIAVLDDERDDAAALDPFGVSGQGGAIGGASVGLERATSALEPSIGDYHDEDLRAAFAADEGCEHVIQPF